MKSFRKALLISMLLYIVALTGCNKEPKTNPTEPVNMAGALFILDENAISFEEQYVQDVLHTFAPADIETILHDRLAESNFFSGEGDFIGTHSYHLLVGEQFLSNSQVPDYIYLWIEDLNILKKIYLIRGVLCDFNPKSSMETECLDEAAGIVYEGSFTFPEDAEFTYAAKKDFEKQYADFEEIVKQELPLFTEEEPVCITVYVMSGFPWELKAGSLQAYAQFRYEDENCDIFEVHLSYDESGQAHMESLKVGSDMENFPEIQKQLLYQYTIP